MSATENAIEVTVGGRRYVVARFRGLKAQAVLRESAKIGRKYPKIATFVADFERNYAIENAVELTRAEAEMRFGVRAQEITPEAWKASHESLLLKQAPSSWERFLAAWPELLDVAEEPLYNLLAITSLSNQEMADADDADELADVVKRRRREILHDGDMDEILELAAAGYEMARTQFAPLVGKMAPLAGMMGITLPTTDEPEQTESSTSPTREPTEDSPESSKTSPTSPPSSTDSPPPTGGTDEPSSAPLGQPSSPAPSA